MRRFWKEVTLEPTPLGQAVRLDGRPVKTPTGNALALPTQKMADAVVAEWEAVEKTLNPILMPVTGFANAAIDRIAPDRAGFAAAIAAYGETDLFCYRGAAGEALAERQAQIWDPWLDWAVVERAGTAEDIWNAACLDELWQEEYWGADHWAQKNRNDRAGEFMAAVHFLDLLTPGT
jgi:chaperone required for assembly of F1-ATPase